MRLGRALRSLCTARLGGAAALVVALAGGPVAADVPVKHEQVVYSIALTDGSSFQSTFATEGARTIYLLAGVDNFISLRKTLVYYWPLEREWKTDLDSLDEPLSGSLVIAGRTRETLAAVDYTFRTSADPSGARYRSYVGAEARQQWSVYDRDSQALSKAMLAYTDERSAADAERGRLITAIEALVQQGRVDDAKQLVDRYNKLGEPTPPRRLDYSVRPIAQAFDVKLPPGSYSVRLVDSTGATYEGSEKRLVVFAPESRGLTGYELIPGDRWTRPEESASARDVLYVDGSSELYLRPYAQNEYNDLAYARMADNQASGSPRLGRWVHSGPMLAGTLRVRAGGRARKGTTVSVSERSYFVRQLPGSALGYTIVPLDAGGSDGQQSASLTAFQVPRAGSRMSFELRRPDGRLYPGSERELRVVRPAQRGSFLFFIALVPIPALAVPLVWRRRIAHRPG